MENKPTANTILNGDIVKALPLRSREDKNTLITIVIQLYIRCSSQVRAKAKK